MNVQNEICISAIITIKLKHFLRSFLLLSPWIVAKISPLHFPRILARTYFCSGVNAETIQWILIKLYTGEIYYTLSAYSSLDSDLLLGYLHVRKCAVFPTFWRNVLSSSLRSNWDWRHVFPKRPLHCPVYDCVNTQEQNQHQQWTTVKP
jgi:hypothetical protein